MHSAVIRSNVVVFFFFFFQEPFGSLYCLTKDKKLVRVDENIAFPNGLAVLHTPEGKADKLIVAETRTQTLWQYDIKGPGQVGKKSVFGKTPGKF